MPIEMTIGPYYMPVEVTIGLYHMPIEMIRSILYVEAQTSCSDRTCRLSLLILFERFNVLMQLGPLLSYNKG